MLTTPEGQALLDAVLSQFQAVLTSPAQVAPGAPVHASVLPAVGQLNAVEALNGVLNAGDLTKHLVTGPEFADVPSLASPVEGPGRPAPTPPDEILRGLPLGGSPAGVAQGSLSQVLAQISLSVPRIDIKVQWNLRVPDGQGGYRPGVEGTDFVSPSGVNLPSLELLLVPPVVELRPENLGATVENLTSPNGPTIPLERWCLFAKVTATLGDAPTLSRNLGPIPLLAAPLPIPTVIALCNRENLEMTGKSKLLVVSPPHVGLASLEELNDVLQAAHSILSRLRMVGKLAGWLVGVGALLKVLPNAAYVAFYARESMGHFDDFPLYSRQFWEDVNINDAVSSMLVLGPPGAEIEFYNEKGLRRGEGVLVMRIPATGFVLIRSMWPVPGEPDARPATIPPDTNHSVLIDDGFENDPDDDGFDNSMTGIRFRLDDWPSTALAPLDTTGCPSPEPVARADLQVTGNLTFQSLTLGVINAGPQTASAVTLDIAVGGGVIKKVDTSRGTATWANDTASVDIGDLPPGEPADVNAVLETHGDVSASATVNSASDDPDPANNSVTLSIIG